MMIAELIAELIAKFTVVTIVREIAEIFELLAVSQAETFASV